MTSQSRSHQDSLLTHTSWSKCVKCWPISTAAAQAAWYGATRGLYEEGQTLHEHHDSVLIRSMTLRQPKHVLVHESSKCWRNTGCRKVGGGGGGREGIVAHSPCASLNMFLMRSMTLRQPEGVSSPTSPVWKKPSSSAAAARRVVKSAPLAFSASCPRIHTWHSRKGKHCASHLKIWKHTTIEDLGMEGPPSMSIVEGSHTKGLLGLLLVMIVALEDGGAANADLSLRRAAIGIVAHFFGRLEPEF